MSAAPNNPARLSFRLSEDQKALIEQAAATLGQTVSDFAIGSLLRMAEETMQSHHTTIISRHDQEAFLAMLNDDSPPNEALRKAMARYKASRG
jgi:uncharacterized protein (DUF1778 family)